MHQIQRSFFLLICLMVLFASFVTAQTIENKSYYLRHNLIFFSGEIPKILPDNIVFTDESICGFYPKVYDSPILNRDTEVKIVSINKLETNAKVVFETKQKRYEILMTNNSSKEFSKAFALVFSEKVSNIKYKYPKNSKGMIKQFGFPIAICKENKGWFYILEFSSSACGSYDGCIIRVTPNGLVASGYI